MPRGLHLSPASPRDPWAAGGNRFAGQVNDDAIFEVGMAKHIEAPQMRHVASSLGMDCGATVDSPHDGPANYSLRGAPTCPSVTHNGSILS